MYLTKKRKLIFLSLFFVISFIFSEEHSTGQMLIMGWGFDETDTQMQTNNAINAIRNYLEAAKYQMSYDESGKPSSLIELYKKTDVYYNMDVDDVFVYINTRSGDVLDRSFEFYFCILADGRTHAEIYKLIVSHIDYSWTLTQDESNSWGLIMKNDDAYNFFVNHIEKYRK